MYASSPAQDPGRKSRVFLVEAQSLFVPALIEVMTEAGLELLGVSDDADATTLLEAQPDVVFVDIDFLAQEPVRLISVLHSMLPQAAIYVYTSISTWIKNCSFPGAAAVFSKHADHQQLVDGLRASTFRLPA
jgi:DNA-binding NarL/FixJ family response regulator